MDPRLAPPRPRPPGHKVLGRVCGVQPDSTGGGGSKTALGVIYDHLPSFPRSP